MWSTRSVSSRYVEDEATYALIRSQLAPLVMEVVELPSGSECYTRRGRSIAVVQETQPPSVGSWRICLGLLVHLAQRLWTITRLKSEGLRK